MRFHILSTRSAVLNEVNTALFAPVQAILPQDFGMIGDLLKAIYIRYGSCLELVTLLSCFKFYDGRESVVMVVIVGREHQKEPGLHRTGTL